MTRFFMGTFLFLGALWLGSEYGYIQTTLIEIRTQTADPLKLFADLGFLVLTLLLIWVVLQFFPKKK